MTPTQKRRAQRKRQLAALCEAASWTGTPVVHITLKEVHPPGIGHSVLVRPGETNQVMVSAVLVDSATGQTQMVQLPLEISTWRAR